MAKTKRSPLIRAIIIIVCIFAFLGLILLGAIGYFRLSVADYYNASQKAFTIPDLDDGFVPQGFHYNEATNTFIISGYMNDHSPSPLYVVDASSGKTIKEVSLCGKSGKDFTGHAGGVAIFGDYVYVAGGDDRCLYVFSFGELMTAEDDGSINCIGQFSTDKSENDYLDVSFVTVHDGSIYVGEFYREKNYPTLPSHKITTSNGDYNQALMLKFDLNATFTDTFAISPTPSATISITDQVQGMAISNGKIYLSTSYGLAFSHILEYDLSSVNNEGTITALGTADIPLLSLDKGNLKKDYKIAPMSEEIVFVDGYLYTMCESASNKYIFGKLTGGKWCYKTDLAKMN